MKFLPFSVAVAVSFICVRGRSRPASSRRN